MSERQNKKRRYNQRLAFIAAFTQWLNNEPAWWRFISRARWLTRRPKEEDYYEVIDRIPDWILADLEWCINRTTEED
jgi:hypothetical protein